MGIDDISQELKNKARECKSAEELMELAKSEGIELSEKDIEGISGGEWTCKTHCKSMENPLPTRYH